MEQATDDVSKLLIVEFRIHRQAKALTRPGFRLGEVFRGRCQVTERPKLMNRKRIVNPGLDALRLQSGEDFVALRGADHIEMIDRFVS